MNNKNLKGLYYIVFFMGVSCLCYSQDYPIRISSNEDEFPSGSLTDGNNGVYTVITRGLYYPDPTPAFYFQTHRNIIYHINDQGLIVDSLQIDTINGYDLILRNIIKAGDSLMVCGNAYRPESESFSLAILYIDNDLQYLGINIPFTYDSVVEFICYTTVDQGDLVFAGCAGEYGWDLILVKTDRYGNFIQESLLPGFTGPSPNIGYIPSKDQIICGRYKWLGYLNNSDFTPDSIFYPLSIDLLSYGFFMPYDSSHCILPAQFYNWDGTIDPGCYVIDTIAQATDTTIFDLRPDQNEAIDIDYISTDTMFLGAIENSYLAAPDIGFNHIDRLFALFKFRMDGELLWENHFGGHDNCVLLDVTATPDGGCVMLGTIYDWRNNPFQERDVLIIKANPNGIYTNITEYEDAGINIFPNPASGEITITLSGTDHSENLKMKIEIFDITGNKLYSRDGIRDDQIRVDISNFSAGVYVVKHAISDHSTLSSKVIVY